jgi:hypothetical protein
MHFTYFQPPDPTELFQGDILERTPALDDLLRDVHPYFQKKDKNLYFMVLTQSCDLVIRPGGACKSSYITITPVRSVDTVLAREIAEYQLPINAEAPVVTDKTKTKLAEFLGRLYNNNEPGYFYLDSDDTDLKEDCCAYLSLAISIKAKLHYQTCLQAKRLQLTAEFQAKLGWLVAQMYSRVGTQDWPQAELTRKTRDTLADAAIYVPDNKAKALLAAFEELKAQDIDARMTAKDIFAKLKQITSKKQQIIKQAVSVIATALPPETPPAVIVKIQNRLESDIALSALLQ